MKAALADAAQPDDAQAERRSMKFDYRHGDSPLAGYTIQRALGKGGFGQVYYAVSDAGKEVALKLVSEDRDIELRGVQTCLNLNHHNLVEVYDVRENAQGETWVVMEYVSGPTLEARLREHPKGLPLEEARAWLAGLLAGVEHLHSQGIVHRDLKPANVFRSLDGQVKIGDYGLSKFISASRRSGHTEKIGTVYYIAPEIARGRYGPEIDIYALGVMMFEMLTGETPFEGETAEEVLMKHLTAAADMSRVPAAFRRVVAGCLEKDPEKRFRSIADIRRALAGGTSKTFESPLPSGVPMSNGLWGLPPEPAFAYVKDTFNWIIAKPGRTIVALLLLIVTVPMLEGPVIVLWRSGAILCFALMYGFWFCFHKAMWAFQVRAGAFFRGNRPHTPNAPPRRHHGAPTNTYRRPMVAERMEAWDPRFARRQKQAKRQRVVEPKGWHQWSSELVGSFVISSVVVAGLLAAITAVTQANRPGFWGPVDLVHLGGVSILLSWTVLLFGKAWETLPGDDLYKRFVMAVAGVPLGVTAYVSHGLLLEGWAPNLPAWDQVTSLAYWHAQLTPALIGSVSFFVVLLFGYRWWMEADPLRKQRVTFLDTSMAGLYAWLLSLLWPTAQPWGVFWGLLAAVAVQVSAARVPNLPPEPAEQRPSAGFAPWY